MTTPWYAVREDVKDALDVLETKRANREIDRQIAAASRQIDRKMHRIFYPEIATRSFDWPDPQAHWPWRLFFEEGGSRHVELAGPLTSLVSGGVTIPLGNVKYYPPDNPPYDWLELDVSSTSVFNATDTWQQTTVAVGPWGFGMDELAAGTLAGNLNATDTSVNLGVPGYRGVGSLLRIDSERFIVTDRSMTTSGQVLGAGGLDVKNSTVLVPVSDSSQYAAGEVILIDGERMRVEDTAGATNLLVHRAWDGSPIAAHTAGATIYANRLLTVERGALGTTAATHNANAAIAEHEPPEDIRQLCVAQAVANLVQTRAGYPAAQARRASLGAGGSPPPTPPSSLNDLWDAAEDNYRRKGRSRAV